MTLTSTTALTYDLLLVSLSYHISINLSIICENDSIKRIDFSNYIVYDIYTGRNTLYTFDH